jgi:hypothetical protein
MGQDPPSRQSFRNHFADGLNVLGSMVNKRHLSEAEPWQQREQCSEKREASTVSQRTILILTVTIIRRENRYPGRYVEISNCCSGTSADGLAACQVCSRTKKRTSSGIRASIICLGGLLYEEGNFDS